MEGISPKESFNNNGHQFHQYHQNEQSPPILPELIEHKKAHDIWFVFNKKTDITDGDI